MAKKQINSRKDAVTKDMQPTEDRGLRSFTFSGLGVTVQAKNLNEAMQKAKKLSGDKLSTK